jgi:hypothetical protein
MTRLSLSFSRRWRVLRWAGLMAALPALWACATRTLEAPELKPDKTKMQTFQETINRDIDILFLVDNSSSMSKSQTNLLNNFPVFMDVLKNLPGGLPNVHIAVVSSDMGAGTGTGGCAGNGQAGIFQSDAHKDKDGNPTCQTTLMDGAKFISNINGVANYTADISQVFSCIAQLGEDGCGFEQSLLSVAHALGADNFDPNGKPQPPAENQGFLREGAYLAIILITNEDDCSAPSGAGSDLFPRANDGSSLSTPLGPPTGYRCNSFGHLCGSSPAAPPIMSPRGAADPGDLSTVVDLQNCTSDEDGKLIPVSAFASAIKALKPNPAEQILVAAISGLYPDTSQGHPYAVTWRTAPSGDAAGPWPEMVHSCKSSADDSFADPGVRIGEWAKAFGRNHVLQSICDASFRPAMQLIADELGRLIGPKCVSGVINKDANGEYACAVSDAIGDGNSGNTTSAVVPACSANGGGHPCWHLDGDPKCTVEAGSPAGTVSLKLTVDRDGMPPGGLSTTINCALAAPQL